MFPTQSPRCRSFRHFTNERLVSPRRARPLTSIGLMALVLIVLAAVQPLVASEAERGRTLYRQLCLECHGETGLGVAGKSDEVLHGDRALEDLARVIDETMPQDHPELCQGEAARSVASYIYDEFYSPTSRLRRGQPRLELAHLTVAQYRNSVADWLGTSDVRWPSSEASGLQGRYYKSRSFKQDDLVLERVDNAIDFQFADQSPVAEKIGPEEFSMRWEGSLVAEESGEYEFCVRSENGVRFWVNDDDRPLIDEWVSSGDQVKEHVAHRYLLAGRAYPLKLHFFKYKDKSASLQLLWRPPGLPRTVIASRYLSTQSAPETLIVATPLPADDRSAGYERGISVSQGWDEATTNAAIETAGQIVARLDRLANTKVDAADRVTRIQEFCAKLVSHAFRRSLTGQERSFYVDRLFAAGQAPEDAAKRSLLLTLKSPRFLYPEIGAQGRIDEIVAARLALLLWDSLPDEELRRAAAERQLRTHDQVVAQTRRMLRDPRTRVKLREFFHDWLGVDEANDLSKDVAEFPGFDELMLADLRESLNLFLDEVVWSEASDYRQLLLADHVFLNAKLAAFYGVSLPAASDEFQPVALDSGQRAGVLTHPFLMTTFAYHRSTSPIHRGVFVTRKLLGRALKPPPMAIEFMDSRFDPELTMREKVSQLTEPAACQNCHQIINPLGFSLEHFDAVGRYREIERQRPIDATAEYVTEDGVAVPLTRARDLAEFAANSRNAQLAFVQQLFQHEVKQPVAAYGEGELQALNERFQASNLSIQELLVSITVDAALYQIEP